jgi:hypothetical protein
MGIKDLPLDSGRKLVKVFESFGWVSHQGKNHIVLLHPDKPPNLAISIPDHRQVDRALLKTEIRKAGLTEAEFCERYKNPIRKPAQEP